MGVQVLEGPHAARALGGTSETVKAFTKKDIQGFIKSNYRTDEIVVGISGNYPLREVIRITENIFAKIPKNVPARKRQPVTVSTVSTEIHDKPINQSHCVMGRQAYSMHHQNKVGLLLLNNLFGGNGMSSRLNLEIREKHGIAYTIESNYSPMSDTGIFSIYLGTDPEKYEKALKLVDRELRKMRDQKLGPVQLQQAKNKFIGQIALGEENRMGVIISMTKSLLDYGRVDTLPEVFQKIRDVSSGQILEIANEMFEPSGLSRMVFQPEGGK